MKKIVLYICLCFSVVLSGCVKKTSGAGMIIYDVAEKYSLFNIGAIYSGDAEDEHYLSDEMLSSAFALGGNVTALRHVTGRAAFFFRDFSGGEIIVLELSDVSHREEIEEMMKRRAKKKNGAEVFSRGKIVILADAPDEIIDYLKKKQ